MEKILKISIPTYSQRQKPKPHIVYHISVTAPVRSWTVQHRYSEFYTLHQKFLELGLKPPLELPPKQSIFSFTAFDNPKFVETRRHGLEEYLQAILASKDERFKKLLEWREFLGISHLRSKTNSALSDDTSGVLSSPQSSNSSDNGIMINNTKMPGRARQSSLDLKSSEQWLDECRDLNVVVNEIRTCIAARNKFVTRNETSAACEALVMARKNHNNLCTRYKALELKLQQQLDDYYSNAQHSIEDSMQMTDSNTGIFSSVMGGVKKQKNKNVLSKGELSRRQDLLENIRKEKEQLEKLLGNMKSIESGSSSTGSTKPNNSNSNNSSNTNNVYSNVKVGNTGRHANNTIESSFSSPGNSSVGSMNSAKSKRRRKFGVNISQEVEESTQGMDNVQILKLQKDMLNDQDKTLEHFTSIISRQRKIGETIRQELDLQSELLDDLDSNVNKVQVSLGQAEKRMKKVLKK